MSMSSSLWFCDEVKNRAQMEYGFHIGSLSLAMSVTIGLSYCPAGATPPCKEGWGEVLATGKAKNCHQICWGGRVLARVSEQSLLGSSDPGRIAQKENLFFQAEMKDLVEICRFLCSQACCLLVCDLVNMRKLITLPEIQIRNFSFGLWWGTVVRLVEISAGAWSPFPHPAAVACSGGKQQLKVFLKKFLRTAGISYKYSLETSRLDHVSSCSENFGLSQLGQEVFAVLTILSDLTSVTTFSLSLTGFSF